MEQLGKPLEDIERKYMHQGQRSILVPYFLTDVPSNQSYFINAVVTPAGRRETLYADP